MKVLKEKILWVQCDFEKHYQQLKLQDTVHFTLSTQLTYKWCYCKRVEKDLYDCLGSCVVRSQKLSDLQYNTVLYHK